MPHATICNRFSGTIKLENANISITPLLRPKMKSLAFSLLERKKLKLGVLLNILLLITGQVLLWKEKRQVTGLLVNMLITGPPDV